MTDIALLMTVDPDAARRMTRLNVALRMIDLGRASREVSRHIEREFGCSYVTAWRVTQMALDLAGK